MSFSPAEKHLRALVKSYQSLNASHCTELAAPPSPLDFSRLFVAQNRPVVIRRGGRGTSALENWTDEYLLQALEEREVQISASPSGNADSIVDGVFVEPANVPLPLSSFFQHLKVEEAASETEREGMPVLYLQSQNGNMAGEFESLRGDVGGEGPAWAREVFGEAPDAVNLWIGGGRSTTSMHKDPYENIYMVVRGTKTFTLLPPTEGYCIHEQLYPHASYAFTPPSSFSIIPTSPPLTLPWIPVDPTNPDLDAHPRFKVARPMEVRLEKGDMLYLPALWYHHVTQSTGPGPSSQDQKLMISVNWWYNVRFEGSFWTTMQYMRSQVLALDGREDPPDDDGESSEEEE